MQVFQERITDINRINSIHVNLKNCMMTTALKESNYSSHSSCSDIMGIKTHFKKALFITMKKFPGIDDISQEKIFRFFQNSFESHIHLNLTIHELYSCTRNV